MQSRHPSLQNFRNCDGLIYRTTQCLDSDARRPLFRQQGLRVRDVHMRLSLLGDAYLQSTAVRVATNARCRDRVSKCCKFCKYAEDMTSTGISSGSHITHAIFSRSLRVGWNVYLSATCSGQRTPDNVESYTEAIAARILCPRDTSASAQTSRSVKCSLDSLRRVRCRCGVSIHRYPWRPRFDTDDLTSKI